MGDTLSLMIESPRGGATLQFEKTDKVALVIDVARKKFGFEPGAFFLKTSTGEVLAPERPLVSFHLHDGDRLLLVPEMGSGV